MAPCYRRVTDFLKGKGVKTILVDTDGNCESLIPWLIDVGVTGCYPMETSAGMDVVKIRKQYPRFQMMGGVPKYDMALGKARIDEFLEPVGRACWSWAATFRSAITASRPACRGSSSSITESG